MNSRIESREPTARVGMGFLHSFVRRRLGQQMFSSPSLTQTPCRCSEVSSVKGQLSRQSSQVSFEPVQPPAPAVRSSVASGRPGAFALVFAVTCHSFCGAQALMQPGLWGVSKDTSPPLSELGRRALGGTAVACLERDSLDSDPYFLRSVARRINLPNVRCGNPVAQKSDDIASWSVQCHYSQGADLEVRNLISKTEVSSLATTVLAPGAPGRSEEIVFKYISPCPSEKPKAASVMEPGVWSIKTSIYVAELPGSPLRERVTISRKVCRTTRTIGVDPYFLQEWMPESLKLRGYTCEIPAESSAGESATLRVNCKATDQGAGLHVLSTVAPHSAKFEAIDDRGLEKVETTSTFEGACPVDPPRAPN
jgi:hypothetical protein